MNKHLLMLDALHSAALGVLDVVLNGEIQYPGAHEWRGMICGKRSEWGDDAPLEYIHAWIKSGRGVSMPVFMLRDGRASFRLKNVALDLMLPSVACRIAGLCLRATGDQPHRADLDLCWEIIAQAMDGKIHPETAARMVALTLRLAPRIAALKVLQ